MAAFSIADDRRVERRKRERARGRFPVAAIQRCDPQETPRAMLYHDALP
jgi:hypothetical protein